MSKKTFREVWHTPLHSFFSIAGVSVVALTMAAIMVGNTVFTINYLDGASASFLSPNTASANYQTAPRPGPIGNIESATTSNIKGWALDTSLAEKAIKVHLYRKAAGGGNGDITYIDEYLANISRPDLVSILGLPAGVSSASHGFNISTPSSFKNGDTAIMYAVAADGSGWSPSIGEKQIGSADVTTTPFKVLSPAPSTNTSTNTNSTSTNNTTGNRTAITTTPTPNVFSGASTAFVPGGGIQVCNGSTLQCNPADGGLGCLRGDSNCERRLNECGQGRAANSGFGICDGNRYVFCRENLKREANGGQIQAMNPEECDAQVQEACAAQLGDTPRTPADFEKCNICEALLGDSDEDNEVCRAAYVNKGAKENGTLIYAPLRAGSLLTSECESGYAVQVGQGVGSNRVFECADNPHPGPCNPSLPSGVTGACPVSHGQGGVVTGNNPEVDKVDSNKPKVGGEPEKVLNPKDDGVPAEEKEKKASKPKISTGSTCGGGILDLFKPSCWFD